MTSFGCYASSPMGLNPSRPNDRVLRIVPRQEFDLEDIPDEIDLLAVLLGHIRSYRLQLLPLSLSSD